MLTIIYGDDIAESRHYYSTLKSASSHALSLDGASVTLTDLQQALSGDDLFGGGKDIFIEDLVSKRKASKELEAITSLLVQSSIVNPQSSIVLWESKELTKTQLKPFAKATQKEFKLPTVIFTFLDSLKPGNSKQLITLFHSLLEHKDEEFVLFMLQRQVRLLLAIHPASEGSSLTRSIPNKDTPSKTISEVATIAPWQKSKVQKQASLFSLETLLRLHEELYKLDLGMKTGGLSQPLADTIDFLLLSL